MFTNRLFIFVRTLVARKMSIVISVCLTFAYNGFSVEHSFWNGYNPFHQPAITTNYYGSGDVNCDGVFDVNDLTQTQNIVSGTVAPNIRADVDGNGVVDIADVNLVGGALQGAILPGWWNKLTTREQRVNWVKRFMERDFTKNVNKYATNYYCGHTNSQCFINGSQYRRDLKPTTYSGGQFFNIPVYVASLGSIGHAINAILVGDDPLNIYDWFFIEPISGKKTEMFNLGSTIYIGTVSGFNQIYYNDSYGIIDFALAKNPDNTYTGTVTNKSYYLQLTRPLPVETTVDNTIDLWNPLNMPDGSKRVLFEKMREDLTRINDIHISTVPVVHNPNGTSSGVSLTGSEFAARLMDCQKAPDGSVHLLWRSILESKTSLMHGTLSSTSMSVENVTKVSKLNMIAGWNIERARILFTSDAKMHVIYQCRDKEITGTRDQIDGVFWSYWTGSEWSARTRIASIVIAGYNYLNVPQDSRYYYFDAVAETNGSMRVVYCNVDSSMNEIVYNQSTASWGSPVQLQPSGQVHGLSMIRGSNNVTHLAYWKNDGALVHSMHNGSYWTGSQIVDDNGNPRFPRWAGNTKGDVYLTWQKTINNAEKPIWNMFSGGIWHEDITLPVRQGADAWYPSISCLANDSIMVSWSSRAANYATVETFIQGTHPVPCDLILSNKQISTTEEYMAGNSITVGPALTIVQPAIIQLQAGQTIKLKPGFSANAGTNMSAYINSHLKCN